MALSPARTIAFDVLRRVAVQDAYADDVLRSELGETIRRDDAGLATELTLGTLRRQRLLDFLMDRYLTKTTKALDIEIRIALRLGIYQLWFLQRVPAHAAVHESVELVKRARKRFAAPLVNAVLRKAAKEAGHLGQSVEAIATFLPKELSPVERLGILHSHPSWLVERWMAAFGETRTVSLLEANNRAPILACYLLNPGRADDARASVQRAGCEVLPGNLLRDAWRLQGGNPASSEALKHCWIVAQDEASQTVSHLLAVRRKDNVLDLCAAPGGKTLWLARAAGAGGHVTAADLHLHRLRAMQERFEHAGVGNIECVVLDGTQALPFERQFQRILVDAPCSGTGTLARHPEIRWRLRVEDLADLHARQVLLLRNALAQLAPAGRLVYSTCSLEAEENKLVVDEVLAGANGAFRIVNPRSALESILVEEVAVESVVDEDGFFNTFPPDRATDGFFAAVIEHLP